MHKVIFYSLFIFSGLICISFTSSEISPFPLSKSSLLWKIEGQNINEECYLFGTMHRIEKDFFIFPKKLEKLVSKSDLILMELSKIPTQSESLPLITLKNGSFFDFFNEVQTDSILDWANREMKLDEKSFRTIFYKMKPFVALQAAIQIQFSGKIESYEKRFYDISNDKKIETIGLENIEQQMSFFDNLSKSDQAEMVMESIRDSKKSIRLLKKMEEVYNRQNVDSLYLLIQEDGGVLAKKQQEFLDNRNKNWIPMIKSNMENKKCFIAVGAGHLGGENGIIRLLQKEGFYLTPINLN